MSFDYGKVKAVMDILSKSAQFVPPDAMGGAGAGAPPPGDPAAAGMSEDPAAMGAAPPMDPAMAGGDPAAMAGGDPAAMGTPSVDPSMMGGMPPMDPAALGAVPSDPGDVAPNGEPYMKITPSQLSKLFKQFAEVFKSVLGIGGQTAQPMQPVQPQAQEPASQADSKAMAEQNAKLDAILSALS